jgi:hypothetical protein
MQKEKTAPDNVEISRTHKAQEREKLSLSFAFICGQ